MPLGLQAPRRSVERRASKAMRSATLLVLGFKLLQAADDQSGGSSGESLDSSCWPLRPLELKLYLLQLNSLARQGRFLNFYCALLSPRQLRQPLVLHPQLLLENLPPGPCSQVGQNEHPPRLKGRYSLPA